MTSVFGVIMVSDPAAAVREMARVLRPGGRLVLATWDPDGLTGGMNAAVEPHWRTEPDPDAPPQADMMDWGRPAVVERWLSEAFEEVRSEPRSVPWQFDSAAAAREFFATKSPLHVAASHGFSPDRFEAGMVATESLFASVAGTDGRIDAPAAWWLISAQRRGARS